MRIMVDTNVILDVFITERIQSFPASKFALKKILEEENDALITASSVTDIFYILRKSLHSVEKAKFYLRKILETTFITDVTAKEINAALENGMPDFEDAVVAETAVAYDCKYIITRNTGDFLESKIPALTPEQFIELI